MSEMLFLSEYCGLNKTSWVCRERSTGLFYVIGYKNLNEVYKESCATEQLAEDLAEDWIIQDQ